MNARLPLRGLVVSGLALTLGGVAQAISGFGAQLVLMRLLVPDDFGRFAVVLAGCSLVQTVLSLRLNVLIIRVPEAELTSERAQRYRAALVWETVAAAAATLTWLTLSGLLDAFALTVVASLALAQWTNQTVAFYERQMAYRGIVVVETGSQMVGHAVAAAVVTAGGGAAALYVREIVVALIRLAAFARLGALTPPCWAWPRLAVIRGLIAEARTFWLEGVAESGFARVVVLATNGVTGLHGTGLFTQGQRLALIPHQFLAPVVSRLAANAFSRTQDAIHRRNLLVWLVSGTLGLLAVAAWVAATFADPLVPLLFGPHWAGVVDVLAALSGVIVFLSGFELLRSYCFALKAVRLVLAARFAQFIVFLAGVTLAASADAPVTALAWSLSASYAMAFATVAGGLLISNRRVAAAMPPFPSVPPPQ
jgi:O-antigen/teichoic acid export membrane protein